MVKFLFAKEKTRVRFHPIHPQSHPNNYPSTQNNSTTHFEDKVLEPTDGTVTIGPTTIGLNVRLLSPNGWKIILCNNSGVIRNIMKQYKVHLAHTTLI